MLPCLAQLAFIEGKHYQLFSIFAGGSNLVLSISPMTLLSLYCTPPITSTGTCSPQGSSNMRPYGEQHQAADPHTSCNQSSSILAFLYSDHLSSFWLKGATSTVR